MNSCILSICIIIRAIALQKNLATATKYSRSNMQEEKAINAKSDQISYNMHGDDFQGYWFCTFQNIPLNVSSFSSNYRGDNLHLDLDGILFLGGVRTSMYENLPPQIFSKHGYQV